MVVAGCAVTAEQGFEHLLAISGEHHRHADVGIVVRRLVDLHRQNREPAARRAHDLDARRLRQQGDSLVIDPVDRVHLPGDQRVEARRAVVDDGHVHAIEKAFALLPVRPDLLEPDPHAWIEVFEHERARADRLRPVLEAVRNHHEMIVGEPIGEIGVGGGERDLDLVIVELLDVGDALHRSRAARFRVATVEVEGIDRVVGREFLAVREGHALAQLEDPVLGAVGRLPALRQFRMRSSVLVPFGEAVPDDRDWCRSSRNWWSCGNRGCRWCCRRRGRASAPRHFSARRRQSRRRSPAGLKSRALEAPSAAARPMNSRREMAPLIRRLLQ